MKASNSGQEPTHDEIALRAFLIWEKDGHQPGREMTYWLQAESEIRSSYQKQAAASAAQTAKPWPPQSAAARVKEVKTAVAAKAIAKTVPKAAPAPQPVTSARLATPAKPMPPGKPAAARASFAQPAKSAARPARRTA